MRVAIPTCLVYIVNDVDTQWSKAVMPKTFLNELPVYTIYFNIIRQAVDFGFVLSITMIYTHYIAHILIIIMLMLLRWWWMRFACLALLLCLLIYLLLILFENQYYEHYDRYISSKMYTFAYLYVMLMYSSKGKHQYVRAHIYLSINYTHSPTNK